MNLFGIDTDQINAFITEIQRWTAAVEKQLSAVQASQARIEAVLQTLSQQKDIAK